MGGKILVVEDETDIQAFLGDYLAIMGYTVRQAANGREALDVLAQWRPHLILLDIVMPVMGGLEFLEIRQTERAIRDIPVIVMSASVNLRDMPLAADAVIPKPFEFDQLLNSVKALTSTRVG